MAAYDFSAVRLFVDAAFAPGAELPLGPEPTNYLANVLRLRSRRRAFWCSTAATASGARASRDLKKRAAVLALVEQTRPQTVPCDLWYLFAPLKHARLDYMVQKAVEMGACVLQPVMTRRTQASRVNLRAHARQCHRGRRAVRHPRRSPRSRPEVGLEALLAAWPGERTLVFCDEDAEAGGAVAALTAAPDGPLAVLIGPEGGFDMPERTRLLLLPKVVRLSLGPRILRADTAAVAALALVQAVRGDWR